MNRVYNLVSMLYLLLHTESALIHMQASSQNGDQRRSIFLKRAHRVDVYSRNSALNRILDDSDDL